MLIGLDFDNTLARYDSVFAIEAKKEGLISDDWQGTKQDLKDKLYSIKDGDKFWQKIQGQVYGPSMHKASLFPGVARFLLRCKLKGHVIFIVSHKTKYGHFDPTKTLLRQVALDWMHSKGFFDKDKFLILEENIFFANTRQEKVEKINNLKLDVFVDDLEEVFSEKSFPDIKKILFSNKSKNKYHDVICNNWSNIENSILGEISNKEIRHLVNSIYNGSVNNIEKIDGRGNSRLYKLSTKKKGDVVLKDYPDLLNDPRNRLVTEVNALKVIEGFNQTPKVVAFDKSQNIALYEWIKGVHLSNIDDEHILGALEFIKNIQSIKNKELCGLASEACLSAKHLFAQIDLRFEKLLLVDNQDLQIFLDTVFRPLWSQVKEWSEQRWPSDNIISDLPNSMQILSPSDFGFHNALLKDNKLYFLDFEYFGRDDSVKLMADFVWHPGMNLSNSQKNIWLKGAFEIFKKDLNIHVRFHAAWPLYGLRWALILLNEFLKDGWQKRVYANIDLKDQQESKLENQLNKAKDICRQIQLENMECPYV
ncbi:phosphotransferase [Candidatus Woesearchaeota archaeon]|nr:phosphotransferase [Candidatus Woesearchaeota archaeon]